MKTIGFRLASCVVVTTIIFLLGSCSLFEDVDDVSFDTTLDETLTVSEPDAGTNVAYEEVLTLDATSDPDISKYKAKIKGFKVNKVSYQIINYAGDFSTVFNGSLSFGDASSSSASVAATVSNLNVKQAYLSGTVYELLINQADIDKIAALLKDDKAVKIYLNGTLSQTPVSFDVNVVMDVTVEANAL